MELKDNQAALILEVDEDGGVSVNVASGDIDGPAGAICQAIAVKLMQDEAFQAEIMDMIEVDDNDSNK
ncbi:MAG: twitching motility protein [Desulfocapsaceae bacterium]|nr:twitching motility protein [Desulfocapsaceae bacterium]